MVTKSINIDQVLRTMPGLYKCFVLAAITIINFSFDVLCLIYALSQSSLIILCGPHLPSQRYVRNI